LALKQIFVLATPVPGSATCAFAEAFTVTLAECVASAVPVPFTPLTSAVAVCFADASAVSFAVWCSVTVFGASDTTVVRASAHALPEITYS